MSKKILILDDDKDIVEIISMCLKREGFETICGYDGIEGLEKISVVKPDLIILDIMMPQMDGYSFNTKLKQNPETKNIPVIVITGMMRLKEIIEAQEQGAIIDYLQKPFKMKEFLIKTKSAIA